MVYNLLPPPKKKPTLNALSQATNGELRADLGTRLKFHVHIAQISLRPDIYFSKKKNRENNK